jgi:hypothetical protein
VPSLFDEEVLFERLDTSEFEDSTKESSFSSSMSKSLSFTLARLDDEVVCKRS